MVSVRKLPRLITNSITLKISIVIFFIETALLCIMGVYYYNRFSSEIDVRVAEKMAIPGTLMSGLALNFEAVMDIEALKDLTKEHVVDAFIVRKDGEIFYAADPERVGQHYTAFIDPAESLRASEDITDDLTISYSSESGENFLSILSPLSVKGSLLGFLYIKILADEIEDRKRVIIYLFLFGSILTILLTTLIEAFFVHHMLVPRIRRTVSSLRQVEAGDFSARVSGTGPPDQIGSLMQNVNSMIEQIEVHTRNLQALTQAGEELAEVRTREDIYEVLPRIAGSRFPVESKSVCPMAPEAAADPRPACRELDSLDPFERKIVASGEILYVRGISPGTDPASPEITNRPRLFIPVIEFDSVKEVICLSVNSREGSPDGSNEIFIRTLSRLMSNAIKRTEALILLSKAEKQYRELFSNAAEGIFLSTVTGRPETVNPSLARMLGYDTPGEMLETIVDMATQVFARAEDGAALLRKIEEKKRYQAAELQLRRKDGTIFWASVSAHAVRNSQGETVGIEGGIIDVSERKRIEHIESRRRILEAADEAKSEVLAVLEQKNKELRETLEELRDTQSRLVQSEKMAVVGTMAGGVAHDLNNILSGIVGYPDLLLMQLPPDSGLRESIEVIRESGTRAAVVVADLLTMARGVAYNTVLFDVNHLVEKYLRSPELKELTHRFRDVSIQTRLAPRLHHTKCSPVHIEKALMNLTTNAFEAIRGKGSVFISTENATVGPGDEISRSLRPGEYVLIRVADSGPGIPEQSIKRVFDPFYTRKVLGRSGSGLGLAVVWSTVQEHGGTVTVESDDRGAIFTIYLPASAEAASVPMEEHPPLDELKGSGTILVVDDDVQLRHIATRILTTLGYGVDAVPSGEEALDFLRARSVDLVLLDMIMDPGMSGYETYREIVRIRPGQKALISSGYSGHEDVKKARELGAGGFLKKPYTVLQLGAAVKKALEPAGGPLRPDAP